MVRPKHTSSKKQKNRGAIDFKKIKRKIGRKLPPKNNATNTEIKSKAIVLQEQSVAADREGLAVSRKGLTLKELLQQTSHHNAKVRRDALIGIKDLSIKYPLELRAHKLAIIEKLRERISDDDKGVRDTLYQLLKTIIFPCSEEGMPGHIISLMVAYIFNAMTHIANDTRFMAFKFFDLVVEHYPSSFFSYADKVLQNYEDILRNKQNYVHDKSRLKIVFVGLVRCVSLLDRDKKTGSSHEQSTNVRRTLHSFNSDLVEEQTGVSSISKRLKDLLPVLVTCFQEMIPLILNMPTVENQSFECMLSILQSINYTVKFFIYGMDKPHGSFGISMHDEHSMTTSVVNSLPLTLKKLFEAFPLYPSHHFEEKEGRKYFILNVRITEVFLHLNDRIGSPAVLMGRFLEFLESVLSWQICSDMRFSKIPVEKHLISLLPFIPRLVLQVPSNWKLRLLEAFTRAFKGCKLESTLKLACLSAIEEMILPTQREGMQLLDEGSQDLIGYQAIWMQDLPELLLQLGDKHPPTSKEVLHLQLRLGQYTPINSSLSLEYNNMQWPMIEFFSLHLEERMINYGPFVKLPRDCQELAICCLYYFSRLSSALLESLARCCLCDDLEPNVLFRIIEVLYSAYKAGYVQITDQISFLVTLLARFKVLPEKYCYGTDNHEKISNRATFKTVTIVVCSCISQMGDSVLILKILQKTILHEMSLKPALDNLRAMIRVVVSLVSKPTKLPEDIICTLGYYLPGYLVDAAAYIPENAEETHDSDWTRIFHYYAQPALCLFYRSDKLLNLLLNFLGSSLMEFNSACPPHSIKYASQLASKIHAVAHVLIFMHKDVKICHRLSSYKAAIKCTLHNILALLASNESNITFKEKEKIQNAFDRLKDGTGRLHLWCDDDFRTP